MENAKISEIFVSYQGEGPFAGSRQLFVRFFGCNLECNYCDTFLESYKTFTKEGLLSKILDFEDNYNELVLTGGEPLLYAGFLQNFLTLYRKHRKHKVYLETNGTLADELAKVINNVDIISMDFKLPSSEKKEKGTWSMHESFIRMTGGKELIAKAVITGTTDIDDIKRMSRILSVSGDNVTVVLQPVTPVNNAVTVPDEEMIYYFKEYIKKETGKNTMILGQLHYCLGIK